MAARFNSVKTKGLTKMYGLTRALAGVDVTLRAGELTLIEGPNGSGKSTLLNLLSLRARSTRGEILFGERKADPTSADDRRAVGVLAHNSMLYPDLSGRENLELVIRLYQLDASVLDEVSERFELGRFSTRAVRTYSRGQMQRVALARAVIHQPRLLLLDEPSTGLDAAATQRLVDLIARERARGAILAVVTHDPLLAADLCDARIRLHRGSIDNQKAPGAL